MRLVSWNVLADAYIRAAYYPHSEPALLFAGARTPAIIDAIANDGAGLCCLQEAERSLVDAARARLTGWDIHYEAKRGKPDGCALLARPPFVLDDVAAIHYGDGSGHLALVATIALGQRQVRIATTHLRWDPPNTPAKTRWATRQARELVAALAPGPAIVCGDLNIEPDDDDVHAIFRDAGFIDAHAAVPRPTANPNGRAKRIDYILTRELGAQPHAAIEIDDHTPLPARAMPSDHVPIAIDLAVSSAS